MSDETLDQQRDVFPAFPERRQIHWNNVQTVEEILPESLFPYHLVEVGTGSRDDPYIDLDRRAAADSFELALLKDTEQLHLQRGRHIPDLIEEQRAAVGLLETTDTGLYRAGEGAFDVSEEFRFQQVLRDRATVDTNQLVIPPGTVEVHRPGDEFLTRSGLSLDQDRRVQCGDGFNKVDRTTPRNVEKAETEQYKRNVEFGRSRLDFTDGVLNNLEVLVERLRFLGLTSIGNPTSGDVFEAEVEGLRDQILNTMNTSFQGRFIFAGSKTNTQPDAKDFAGVATYQGDNKAVKLQVGRSAKLDTQMPGSEISSSIDVFAVIAAFDQARQSGDRSAIDAELKNLQMAWEGLSVSRSRIGGLVNVADSTRNELTALSLARETALVDIEAADLTKTLTEFRSLEGALQNTLAIGARISRQTLLDYLR